MTDNNLNDRVTSLETNVDRFADFVLQNQRFQQVQIDELREGQRGLTQAMQDLIQLQREVITRFDAMQVEIQEMQSEIRGLQTENRRLLDLYLNEQEPPEESN